VRDGFSPLVKRTPAQKYRLN